MSLNDGNACTAACTTLGLRRFPRSAHACRALCNATKGPSSVRWVTFGIIAARIWRRTANVHQRPRVAELAQREPN